MKTVFQSPPGSRLRSSSKQSEQSRVSNAGFADAVSSAAIGSSGTRSRAIGHPDVHGRGCTVHMLIMNAGVSAHFIVVSLLQCY